MNSTPLSCPSPTTLPVPVFRAAADIHETSTQLTVLCDLPGVAPEDLIIEIKDQVLTVSGTPGIQALPEGEAHLEYRSGTWKRSFQLHCEVDEPKSWPPAAMECFKSPCQKSFLQDHAAFR